MMENRDLCSSRISLYIRTTRKYNKTTGFLIEVLIIFEPYLRVANLTPELYWKYENIKTVHQYNPVSENNALLLK